MRDKDYDADFPAGATWKDRVLSLPFLVLGKTIELIIRARCRLYGHSNNAKTIGYCDRCHSHFPEYD